MTVDVGFEKDFLDYNASLLQVLVQHRLLRDEEADDLRDYLTRSDF